MIGHIYTQKKQNLMVAVDMPIEFWYSILINFSLIGFTRWLTSGQIFSIVNIQQENSNKNNTLRAPFLADVKFSEQY